MLPLLRQPSIGHCHVVRRLLLHGLRMQHTCQPGASAVSAHLSTLATEQPCSETAQASCSAASGPQEGESLIQAALRILYEPDAVRKGELTHRTAELWRAGKLPVLPGATDSLPDIPDNPARDDTVCPVNPCGRHSAHA
jgi:hypothetical protein